MQYLLYLLQSEKKMTFNYSEVGKTWLDIRKEKNQTVNCLRSEYITFYDNVSFTKSITLIKEYEQV